MRGIRKASVMSAEDLPPTFSPQQTRTSLISTPYGLIPIPNYINPTIPDGQIDSPQGSFDVFSAKPGPDVTQFSAPAVNNATNKNQSMAELNNGPPLKMVLYTTDTSGNGKLTWTFQYNPETLEYGEPSKFGAYSGVTRTPRIYYSGRDADRIQFRILVQDRINGVKANFDKLRQFAMPIGTPHQSSSQTSTFQAPPLCMLDMKQAGVAEGYVENPRLSTELFASDLTPILGYITFTFIAIRMIDPLAVNDLPSGDW